MNVESAGSKEPNFEARKQLVGSLKEGDALEVNGKRYVFSYIDNQWFPFHVYASDDHGAHVVFLIEDTEDGQSKLVLVEPIQIVEEDNKKPSVTKIKKVRSERVEQGKGGVGKQKDRRTGKDKERVSEGEGTNDTEDIDPKILSDIEIRAEGVPQAKRILTELAKRGSRIYNRVAPHLGTGTQVQSSLIFESLGEIEALVNKYDK